MNVSTGSIPANPLAGAAVAVHSARATQLLAGEQQASAYELRNYTHTVRKGATPIGQMLLRSMAVPGDCGVEFHARGDVFDPQAVAHLTAEGEIPFLPIFADSDYLPVEKRSQR